MWAWFYYAYSKPSYICFNTYYNKSRLDCNYNTLHLCVVVNTFNLSKNDIASFLLINSFTRYTIHHFNWKFEVKGTFPWITCNFTISITLSRDTNHKYTSSSVTARKFLLFIYVSSRKINILPLQKSKPSLNIPDYCDQQYHS